jgi:hypothetical protein
LFLFVCVCVRVQVLRLHRALINLRPDSVGKSVVQPRRVRGDRLHHRGSKETVRIECYDRQGMHS